MTQHELPLLADILPSKVTAKHHELYGRALGNWSYLSHFLSNGATKEELGVMLKMELDGEKRDFIIHRILGRINSLQREALKKEVDKYLLSV